MKSKIKALADCLSGKGKLPGSWRAGFLLCPHMAERERELAFWGIFHKGTNHTYEVFTFMIQSFPQTTSSKIESHWRQVSRYNFWEDKNIKYLAGTLKYKNPVDLGFHPIRSCSRTHKRTVTELKLTPRSPDSWPSCPSIKQGWRSSSPH